MGMFLFRAGARAGAGAGATLPGIPRSHGQPIVHLPFMAAGAGAAHLAKILLFKKVGFWGAYGATKVYGWPRVTRTLLQYNKQHTPEAAQSTVQAAIITAIRTPAQAYGVFQDSEVYAFIGKVARSGGDAIPPWVQSIAASIAGKTHVWKALRELEAETKRKKAAEMKADLDEHKEDAVKMKAELADLAQEKARCAPVPCLLLQCTCDFPVGFPRRSRVACCRAVRTRRWRS